MSLKPHREAFPRLVPRLLASRLAGRVSQGYLCVGDQSETVRAFAQSWIQVLVCAAPLADGDACRSCDNCRRLEGGLYPEFYIVRPASKMRMIQVEQMNELMDCLSRTAGPGRRKVGLLLDADCMNAQAQNSFLKTLEEPDPNTLILLCTTQPKRLLPTIRSRCQVITLLTNSCDHQEGLQKGLFSALVPLVPGVLPETALRVAARIQAIFDTLEQEAKDWVAEHREPRWIAAEKSDDKKFKDEMKKQEEAAVSAEYLRRRTAMLEGIQTWFQQVELLARGLAPEAGPCPELLAGLSRLPEISLETLPLVQKALGTLSACFHTNANEELALEAFCLEVARAGNLKA